MTWGYARQLRDYARVGDGVAQYSLRITLLDESLLQCVERASCLPEGLRIDKCNFHVNDEDHVLSYTAVDMFGVLERIDLLLAGLSE